MQVLTKEICILIDRLIVDSIIPSKNSIKSLMQSILRNLQHNTLRQSFFFILFVNHFMYLLTKSFFNDLNKMK